jgi:hypothetical protein
MTREMVKRLRPEVIDTLGLRDAVEEMIRQYNSLHATCVFEFQAAGDFSDLRGDLAISTYRIIQEALSNVVKHVRASPCSFSPAVSRSWGGRTAAYFFGGSSRAIVFSAAVSCAFRDAFSTAAARAASRSFSVIARSAATAFSDAARTASVS